MNGINKSMLTTARGKQGEADVSGNNPSSEHMMETGWDNS